MSVCIGRVIVAVAGTSAGLCAPAPAQGLAEGFEGGAIPAAWVARNQSSPAGTTTWTARGGVPFFGASSGAYSAQADYRSGAGAATLSNWLILPEASPLSNGDTLSFWTRQMSVNFPDRLQVRMSTAGSSTHTGTTAADVGDFTSLLLDINPAYTGGTIIPDGYPVTWTQVQITVTGLPAAAPGRFAFRYFVENGGPEGVRSFAVGIDDVMYTPAGGVGACCMPDGTCAPGQSQAACAQAAGVFTSAGTACAAANCPQPGACCLSDGACLPMQPGACASAGGAFMGAGVLCGGAGCGVGACCLADGSCAQMSRVACANAAGKHLGEGSACVDACPRVYLYPGPALPVPDGNGPDDCGPSALANLNLTDTYTIGSVDAAFLISHPFQGDLKVSLMHTTPQNVLTVVYMVDRAGHPGLTFGFSNDNYGSLSPLVPFRSSDSGLLRYDTGQGGVASGIDDVSGVWQPDNPMSAFNGRPAAGLWRLQVEDCWGPSDTGTLVAWSLIITPAPPPPCYANCDGSTATPVLNVADFTCFLQNYAGGNPGDPLDPANCDGSTAPPTLNIADFTCFLQKYAIGCP